MSNWRQSREYRIWRAGVIRRDKRCKICDSIKNRHAHHIDHATYFPEKRFRLDNGVCLCQYCHSQFHNNFKNSTREKCTRKDWYNFVSLVVYIGNVYKKFTITDIISNLSKKINP